MPDCKHTVLTLMPQPESRLRCRHCHLTISPEELQGSYCPECYEAYGQKRSDFEEIEADTETTRYRCEDCGAIIEVE